MRELVAHANALSVIVFAQAVQIENMRRQLDRNAATFVKCKETIEALMDAAFGKMEVFDVQNDGSVGRDVCGPTGAHGPVRQARS